MTEDLPPSCKYVHHVLAERGPCSRQALREHTDLPEPTLDWALDRLKNHGYLSETRDSDDLRQVQYNIHSDPNA